MANGTDNPPRQLSVDDFAATIKKQYPVYDKIPNQQLVDEIIKKYPQYKDRVILPSTKESTEPKFVGWMTPGLSTDEASKAALKMDQSKLPSYFMPMSPTGISVDPQHAKTEATQIGAGLGGLGMGALAGLRAGGAVLPKLVQMVARATGTAGGATAVGMATGSKPGEAAITGAGYGTMELGGEALIGALGKGWQMFRKLWAADPKRMADLGELVSTSEKVKEFTSNPREMLSELDAKNYPDTSQKVKLMPAAKTAQQAEKSFGAASPTLESVPPKVSRLADIGRARQRAALSSLAKAGRILKSGGGSSEEVEALLAKAKSQGELDFMDAQKIYSSLGRAIAQGKGMLPIEQYEALSTARDALEDSMQNALRFEYQLEQTAKAAGVMPEGELGDFYRFRDSQTGGSFSVRKSEYSASKLADEVAKLRKSIPDTTQLDPLAQQKIAGVRERFEQWQPVDKVAQWEKAQAAHKQFIDDFFRTGGPLTKVVNAAEGDHETVIKHLLADPATRASATKALARYGFDINDLIKMAAKWRDPTELNRAIADAARLEQVGQDIFGKQEGRATRKAVGKFTAKKLLPGAALTGYALWELLKGKSPSLMRSQP